MRSSMLLIRRLTVAEFMLEEALKIVNGDRQNSYGGPRHGHERIAKIWSVILERDITPEQVVLCMIGLKLARLCNSPNHRDSWVDIAGYVGVKDLMGDPQ
jgi:hypothetical protein